MEVSTSPSPPSVWCTVCVQYTEFELPDTFGNFVHHLFLHRLRPHRGVLHFEECYRRRGMNSISSKIDSDCVDQSLNIPAFVAF